MRLPPTSAALGLLAGHVQGQYRDGFGVQDELAPRSWPRAFAESPMLAKRDGSCHDGRHPCSDVNSTSCCPNDQYCIVNNAWTVQCCALGSNCDSDTACDARHYYANVTMTTTVTDSASPVARAAVTTLDSVCQGRACYGTLYGCTLLAAAAAAAPVAAACTPTAAAPPRGAAAERRAEGLASAAKAGIAAGIVVFAALLLAALTSLCVRRRRRRRRATRSTATAQEVPSGGRRNGGSNDNDDDNNDNNSIDIISNSAHHHLPPSGDSGIRSYDAAVLAGPVESIAGPFELYDVRTPASGQGVFYDAWESVAQPWGRRERGLGGGAGDGVGGCGGMRLQPLATPGSEMSLATPSLLSQEEDARPRRDV